MEMRDRRPDFFEAFVALAALLLIAVGAYHLYAAHDDAREAKSRKTVAVLSQFEGAVQFKEQGSFVWRKVTPGMKFSEGDSIRTGENSGAGVSASGEPVQVRAASLLIFRERRGNSGGLELVFGEAEKNKQPVAPVVAAAGPASVKKAEQDLWWIAPESVVRTSDEQPHIRVAWGAQHTEKFAVELTGAKIETKKTETREQEATFAALPTGEYTVTVTAGAKKITKKFSVENLSAPSWITGASLKRTDEPVQYDWKSGSHGESELRIYDGQTEIVNQVVTGETFTLTPIQPPPASRTILTARVRTKTSSGAFSPWSPPLIVELNPSVSKLELSPMPKDIALKAAPNGNLICAKPAVWKANAATEIVVASGDDRWTLPASQPSFCPEKPGRYVLKLRRVESDGRIAAVSNEVIVTAGIEAPEISGVRLLENGEHLVRLENPLLFPLVVQIENSKGEPREATIGSFDEPITFNEDDLRFRVKYSAPDSPWSRSSVVPPPAPKRMTASKSAPEAEVSEALRIRAMDSGPTLSSGSSNLIWTELRWTTNAKALRYDVEISPDGRFEGEQKLRKVGANKLFMPFETSKNFYWRARAVATDGTPGPWTKTIAATVQAVNPNDPAVTTRSKPHSDRQRAPSRATGAPDSK